jgi:type II secretory pathway component PulF
MTETPHPSGCGRLVGVAGILLVHCAALFLVLAQLCKTIPMYEEFFEQQDVALPVVTAGLLRVSVFCRGLFFHILGVCMTIDAGILLLLTYVSSKTRWMVSAYSHLLLLAACGLLLYTSAWLAHPVYNLVQPN